MKAYPQAQFRGDEPVDTAEHGGMDLRDYFAAKAMQAVVGDPDFDGTVQHEYKDRVARHSYGIADAMMKAREVKP